MQIWYYLPGKSPHCQNYNYPLHFWTVTAIVLLLLYQSGFVKGGVVNDGRKVIKRVLEELSTEHWVVEFVKVI
jgi:hypothetical protein